MDVGIGTFILRCGKGNVANVHQKLSSKSSIEGGETVATSFVVKHSRRSYSLVLFVSLESAGFDALASLGAKCLW